MSKFLWLLWVLSLPVAVYAQDSLAVSFSEEPDTLPKQRFLDKYENVFMTKVQTRHMAKIGISQYIQAIPYPLIDDKTLNKITLHLGYEFKLLPAFSLALSGFFPLYGAGAPVKEKFQNTVVDAQLRWFFDMRRRIREGKSANNFSGNYLAVFFNIPGTATYDNKTGLRLGFQRRFLNYGYMDFSFTLSKSSYQFTLQSQKDLSIATQASFGFAIGDWKRAALPPLCDILLCDEFQNDQWKVRLPDFSISYDLKRFRTGVAYERKLFNSPFTVNIQFDGAVNQGVNTLRYDHEQEYLVTGGGVATRMIPYALVNSSERIAIVSLQPRYYVLQKRQRLLGKGGNGLSGWYTGINSEFNYYKGRHRFKVLDEGDLNIETSSIQIGPLLGFQLRLFRHGYLDINAAYNFKYDLKTKGHSFAVKSNIGLGLAF